MPDLTAIPLGVDPAQKPLHVLVICTHFPPLNRTGARRPYYLARQLRDEGHRVSVLTSAETDDTTWEVNLNGIQVMRCPHSFVQRDMRAWQRWIAKAHNHFQGSIIHGPLRVLADVLLPLDHATRWDISVEEVEATIGPADIVVSTGPAWSSFDFGRRLSRAWGSTFLIDYRDPWYVHLPEVGLHAVTWMGAGLSGKLRRMRMKRSERRIISTAAGTTTATEGLSRNISLAGAEPNCVVFNGFESRPKGSQDTYRSGLHLIYTGQLYAEQEWDLVILAFELLHDQHIEQAKQIKLILLGPRCVDPDLLSRIHACAERTGSITFI
ncbi:MAG: glycosyltransferase, partial [Flavobacteriales bacterium]